MSYESLLRRNIVTFYDIVDCNYSEQARRVEHSVRVLCENHRYEDLVAHFQFNRPAKGFERFCQWTPATLGNLAYCASKATNPELVRACQQEIADFRLWWKSEGRDRVSEMVAAQKSQSYSACQARAKKP